MDSLRKSCTYLSIGGVADICPSHSTNLKDAYSRRLSGIIMLVLFPKQRNASGFLA